MAQLLDHNALPVDSDQGVIHGPDSEHKESDSWWSPHGKLIAAALAKWTDEHPGMSTSMRFIGPGFLALAGLLISMPTLAGAAFVAGMLTLTVLEFGRHFRGSAISGLKTELTSQSRKLQAAASEAEELRANLGQQDAIIDAAKRVVGEYATSVLRRMVHQSEPAFEVDCRISLYFVQGSALRIVARFSQDTELQVIGDGTKKESFEREHGLIGTAMQTGMRQRQKRSDFPSDSYANWQRVKCNLVGAGKLRMKSEQYDVIPLSNPDTKDVVGVVSLETLDKFADKLIGLGESLALEDSFQSALLRDVIQMYSSLQEPQKIETRSLHE